MTTQSMHDIRVTLATTKLACKNCGREYAPADAASLRVCESCGIALVPDGIAAETRQSIVVEKNDAPSVSSTASIDSTGTLEARISVKRFVIKECASKFRAYAIDTPACQPASWINLP